MKFFLVAFLLCAGCATERHVKYDEPQECIWDGSNLQCAEGHYEKPVQRSPAVVEE